MPMLYLCLSRAFLSDPCASLKLSESLWLAIEPKQETATHLYKLSEVCIVEGYCQWAVGDNVVVSGLLRCLKVLSFLQLYVVLFKVHFRFKIKACAFFQIQMPSKMSMPKFSRAVYLRRFRASTISLTKVAIKVKQSGSFFLRPAPCYCNLESSPEHKDQVIMLHFRTKHNILIGDEKSCVPGPEFF